MPPFQGQISQDGRVVLESVAGDYFPYTGRRGRLAWSGGFDLAPGHALETGGPYRLTLTDGRSGEIAVDLITLSSRGVAHVHFSGLSPLQESSPADPVDTR
jgi:hypothetical protein